MASPDDPVVASYNVLLKPPLPAHRRLLVLQYPNAHSDDPAALRSPAIAELRYKPASGMLEADLPLDHSHQYDRPKGIAWGAALQRSLAAKGGGSLGLAGGFGIGAAPARGRRGGTAAAAAAAAGDDDDIEGGDWAEAVRQDKVLRTQTLGGISVSPRDARYMVGVFQGKNIHLTPVSSLAHLRPQMHYIDAAAEQDRLGRTSGGGGGGGGAKEGGPARAIHMTIKSAATEGAEVVTETIADRLRAVQVEGWRRMEYAEEDTEDAWNAYQECLLLPTADAAAPPTAKGKEPASDPAPVPAPFADDPGFDALETQWGEEELLRALAGIGADDPKPGEEAVRPVATALPASVAAAAKTKASKGKEKEVVPAAEPRKRATRSRTTAGTGTRRGGKT